MNATYVLETATASGSYWHQVAFQPTGQNQVKVTETMRDELCGNYDPRPQVRVLAIAEARGYYRTLKRARYS
jgi:hypothetical protein